MSIKSIAFVFIIALLAFTIWAIKRIEATQRENTRHIISNQILLKNTYVSVALLILSIISGIMASVLFFKTHYGSAKVLGISSIVFFVVLIFYEIYRTLTLKKKNVHLNYTVDNEMENLYSDAKSHWKPPKFSSTPPPRHVEWKVKPKKSFRSDNVKLLAITIGLLIVTLAYADIKAIDPTIAFVVIAFFYLLGFLILIAGLQNTQKQNFRILQCGDVLPALIAGVSIQSMEYSSVCHLFLYYIHNNVKYVKKHHIVRSDMSDLEKSFNVSNLKGVFLSVFVLDENPDKYEILELSPFKLLEK